MFKLDPERLFVQVAPDAISALYRSVTNVTLALPDRPVARASAVIVGYRVEARRYGVVLALHMQDSREHLIFTGHDEGLDPNGAREAAQEAIAFAESMGFFMENAGWKGLAADARRELLRSLQVFAPFERTVEAPKIVDPRTKLARLLVQF